MTSTMTTDLDTLEIQSKLSKTWRVLGKHEVVYTGGHVVYSRDHTHMVCIHGEDPTAIIFYRLSTGQVVHHIDCGEDDPIATFTLSPNQQLLYTAHIRSGLIKVWNIDTKYMTASWKAEHKNDVVSLELDPTGTLIASASLDQAVKIRYSNNGHLTHQFFNHGGPISTISWHPNVDKLIIAVGTQTGVIRVHWLGEGTGESGQQPKYIDLMRNDYDGTPNKSHFSRITSLTWSQCQTKLISVGYDKMWRIWDFCSEYNLKTQMSKLPIRSIDLVQQFQPQLSLNAIEIASYLVLDELENVKTIPYQCPVPMRKKDTNEYVTKILEEEANGAIYFITSGQRGVTTIWKVSYDYALKKKSIGIVFKHTSLQSYSTQNIPYSSPTYQSKLYAITTGSTGSAITATDNEFDTPLHLQWHKMSLYLPPSILQLQQPVTNKVITLKDGRTITKPVPSKEIIIPQLPLLDTDKEYQNKLLDEMKFYESQDMLQRENKYRRVARQQLRLENNMAAVEGDDQDDDEGEAAVEEVLVDENGVEVPELTDEEKKLQQTQQLTEKLQKFRGIASTVPQIMLLNGDHNLYTMDLPTFDINKIFSLYSLQINDVKIIPNSRCVVVATNSNQLRIFNIDTLNCSILFPHKDIIVTVAVSLCGRFIMSSTTRGEIFVWVLYHYDSSGFIPLPIEMDDNNADEDGDDNTNDDVELPPPFHERRLATRISAHIVAELKGHTEAPSALVFSNNATPSFEQRLVSVNGANNKIDNPQQSVSKFINVPTVYNYNRLLLFACTGGSDKTVKTWNLSSLYVFVDPALYGSWSKTSQYYKSVLLSPPLPSTNTTTPTNPVKITKEQVITMNQPDKHIFVQLADKTIVNASFIMYNSLLYSSTVTSNTNKTSSGMMDDDMDYVTPPTRIVFGPVTTTLAHEKDINSIIIHPNNTTIATCAEDKTCKIWKYNNSSTLSTSLKLLGTLKGHRRTVWQIIFTPREKFIITVSGDKLIKVWSTVDYSCVQTLQGHTAPVVQIAWLRYGLQFMTGDANGILRLWNLYDNNNGECVSVCDEPHEARINGLDIDHYRNDSFMVTGDTAAKLVFWHDTTLYDEMMAKQQEQSNMLLTQLLENALKHKDLLKAFELALKLHHPRNLFHILSDIIDNEQRYKRWKALKTQRDIKRQQLRAYKIKLAQRKGDTKYDPDNDPDIVGQDELYLAIEARENLELRVPKPKITVKKLISIRTTNELESLMAMLLDWNTNSRFSYVAQFVLEVMTTTLSPDIITQIPHFKSKVQIFTSYSQRHYTRAANLLQSSYLVDHVLSNMNIYMPLHEQERSHKVLQQQQLMQQQAELFGGDTNNSSAADWLLLGTADDQTNETNALQHILSLQVDDSLLQYEVISDDEDGLGAITTTQKQKDHIAGPVKKKEHINYYYGSNIQDPYASSSDDDDSDYYSDEDEIDIKSDQDVDMSGMASFGDWGDDNKKPDPFVQLSNTKTIVKDDEAMPSFGFDSTWGDFDDDWEAMAASNEAKLEVPEPVSTKSKQKRSKKTQDIAKVEITSSTDKIVTESKKSAIAPVAKADGPTKRKAPSSKAGKK